MGCSWKVGLGRHAPGTCRTGQFCSESCRDGRDRYLGAAQFVAQGDRVLAVGDSTGRIKATDQKFKDEFVFALTVRDGKVVHIQEYIDTLAMARASGIAGAGVAEES